MIDYLNFNLTEYKSFRQLQLEYTKLRNQYENVCNNFQQLENAYESSQKQLIKFKAEQFKQCMNKKKQYQKYKNFYIRLKSCIEANFNLSLQKQCKSKLKNTESQQIQSEQQLVKLQECLQYIANEQILMKQNNDHLTKLIQKSQGKVNEENNEKQKTQHQIYKQINKLQVQLEGLHDRNVEYQAKLKIKQKQIESLDKQLRCWKRDYSQLQHKYIDIAKLNQDSQQVQDHSFALDLLSFQKQYSEKLFNRVIVASTMPAISQALQSIYLDYEEISEVFQQKLQIQYDLEELEKSYKIQKTNNIDDQILIQMRGQIQSFRSQLYQQKQLFKERQRLMTERINQYQNACKQEMKLRNYSYELQKRIANIKRNPESSEKTIRQKIALKLKKQQSKIQQQRKTQLKTSVKFKQSTNVEELMKQMIKKDKDNLEKLLKDTRKNYV